MNSSRSVAAHFGALAIVVAGFFAVVFYAEKTDRALIEPAPAATTTLQTTEPVASSMLPTVSTSSVATSTPPLGKATTSASSTVKKAKKTNVQATKTVPVSSPNEIARIENPYASPPLPFETVNLAARAALVNILCMTQTTGSLKPITGSGILIDSRGVVLTNAHVAQYVLLAQSGRTDLRCTVRTGAPAESKWIPVVMYIPQVWIEQHASDIIKSHALGTGEHDYALLYLASTTDKTALPSAYPAVTPDIREAIGFVDDNVLAASYPVEFIGGTIIQGDLYPVSSITTIRQLMTFAVGSADVVSLGGIIGAQSGSSGGGVVNQWNKLIGLITTTSDGATTAERDLHAITTAYINRDIRKQTGIGLVETLATNPKVTADAFAPQAALLAEKLFAVIQGR